MTDETTPPAEWTKTRRRLRRDIIASLREAKQNSADRTERLLDERTERLAARRRDRHSQDIDGGREVQFLVCSVGEMQVGFRIGDVAAVLPHQSPIPVPSRHAAMLGIVSAGALLHNVIDLASLVGASRKAEIGKGARLVLLRRATPKIAFHVDEVSDTRSVPLQQTRLEGAPLDLRGVAGYLSRGDNSNEQGIAILDLDALLAPLLSSTLTTGAA